MSMNGKWYDWTFQDTGYVTRGSGVYELADREYETVLYGSSKELQDLLVRMVRVPNLYNKVVGKARYFRFEACDNPDQRLQELLNEFQQQRGRLPEGNATPTAVRSA